MEIIKVLGLFLSNQVKISPTAARGLIKLAIKDEIGPFTDFSKITYVNLQNVIENSLRKRLTHFKIQDIDTLIEQLSEELKKNQSLITLANI